MKIEKFVLGSFGTNCYLIINEETKELVIVDPATCPDYVVSHVKSEGYQPVGIFITHGHFDHVEALPEWFSAFSPKVYIGEADAPMLSNASLNAYRFFYGEDRTYLVPHETLREGDELSLCGAPVSVLSVPGHSPGSLIYLLPNLAFVGDLIFAGGGYGRFDLPGGDYVALVSSLRRVQRLSSGITLYPGHGESFKL